MVAAASALCRVANGSNTTMPAKTQRQLSLQIDEITAPRLAPARKIETLLTPLAEPTSSPLDQILSTREIVKLTGRHRVTIYRWIRAGIFPKKHEAQGHKVGWLRSDVERWLKRDLRLPS
jgi:prophage regulatory protein